jgi:hypothetical protein
MITSFRTTCAAALLGLAATATQVHSADVNDKGVFDVSVRGLNAATLTFSGVEKGGRYVVNGKLKSAGLAAMVRKVSYTATAKGAVSQGRYTPFSYSENADTGKRKSQSEISYSRGVPKAVKYAPAREPSAGDVDPASMGGTVDPLTSLYATLRDVDAGQECKTSVKMFDGRRASKISLSKPTKQGDTVVCAGEYRRLKGFSAKDMAEKTRFPFTLSYSPTADGRMRVTEISLDTIYGKARMKRR